MLKRIIASVGFLIIAGTAPAFAQYRFEASVWGGWSFSDGVSGGPITAGDGQVYDRIDPEDGGVFGLGFGYFLNDNAEAGFQWNRQWSTLLLGGAPIVGTPDRELGDFRINDYHGYFAYNFGEPDKRVRPFVFGGLGATHFGSVDFSDPRTSRTSIGGNTKFSTIWGGGAKVSVASRVAVRGAFTWVPTFIKTDTTGWWCDPFWGCYLTGNAQYANQVMLTGGATFRF